VHYRDLQALIPEQETRNLTLHSAAPRAVLSFLFLVRELVLVNPDNQRSKLTVVRLSRTTKIRLGQPDCMKWLPLGQPKVFVKT
jgi:hypothetical protein